MIWNPFAHLVKTRKYPFSHFISSSLKRRFLDTAQVFFGTFFEDPAQMGILDYALVLSKPAEKAIQYIYDTVFFDAWRDTALFTLPLVLLHALSIAPKGIAMALLVGLCAPLILTVHLVMQPIKWFLKRKADQIVVKETGENLFPKRNLLSRKTNLLLVPGLAPELEKKPFTQELTLEALSQAKDKLKIHLFIRDPVNDEFFIAVQNRLVLLNLFSAFNLYRNDDVLAGIVGIMVLNEENVDAITRALNINRFGITKAALRHEATLPALEEKIEAIQSGIRLRAGLSDLYATTTRFPSSVVNLTFCYAGIANKKQHLEFENSSRVGITEIVEIKNSEVASPQS